MTGQELAIVVAVILVILVVAFIGINAIASGQRDRVRARIHTIMQDGVPRTVQAIRVSLGVMPDAQAAPVGMLYIALHDLETNGFLRRGPRDSYIITQEGKAAAA